LNPDYTLSVGGVPLSLSAAGQGTVTIPPPSVPMIGETPALPLLK